MVQSIAGKPTQPHVTNTRVWQLIKDATSRNMRVTTYSDNMLLCKVAVWLTRITTDSTNPASGLNAVRFGGGDISPRDGLRHQ
jgi:hypothetical protein